MGKQLYVFIGLITVALMAAGDAAAQDVQTTPTKYQFTVSKLELCQSATCGSPTVLGDRTATFDIGSGVAGAGQPVGSYVDQVALTIGATYTHVRVTMGRAFILSGGAAAGVTGGGNAGACFTDGTGTGAASTATTQATSGDSDASGRGGVASDMTMFVPNVTGTYAGNLTATYAGFGVEIVDGTTMRVIIALTAPFTVTEAAPTFSISFNVANTLNLLGVGADTCVLWHQPPVASLALN